MPIAPAFPIVDLHCHVIATDTCRYPLSPLGGKQSDWASERPVDDVGMLAAMAQAGISRSALVQASTSYSHDNAYVQACVTARPDRFIGVFSVNMVAPDATQQIDAYMAAGLSGVRVFIAGHTAADRSARLDDPRSFSAWAHVTRQRIPTCVQLRADGLPQLEQLLERFPQAVVVLDHFARPDIQDGPPYAAAARLFALARFPNLHFKFTTHNVRESRAGKATQPSFSRAMVDHFGAHRLAWGSNFPASGASLPQLLNEALEATASLSTVEQEWIFSRTAHALYPALRAGARVG